MADKILFVCSVYRSAPPVVLGTSRGRDWGGAGRRVVTSEAEHPFDSRHGTLFYGIRTGGVFRVAGRRQRASSSVEWAAGRDALVAAGGKGGGERPRATRIHNCVKRRRVGPG